MLVFSIHHFIFVTESFRLLDAEFLQVVVDEQEFVQSLLTVDEIYLQYVVFNLFGFGFGFITGVDCGYAEIAVWVGSHVNSSLLNAIAQHETLRTEVEFPLFHLLKDVR
jgi:hypothetical protein